MTNHRTLLRDALLAVPVFTGIGWAVGGGWMALGTAIAGLVTVGNLWIIMMLTYRLTRGLSVQGEGLGMVGLVAVVKFPLAIGAYTLVAYAFDVLAAFLGLLVLVVPVVVRGAVYLARTPIPSDSNELEVEGM